MINIAILASGSGTNAEALVKHFKNIDDISVVLILCNKENAGVFERAERLGVENAHFTKDELESDVLITLLKTHKIDLIVLAGFLLKVPSKLILAYPNRIINIHPALLPKYGGKGMYGMKVHQSVIDDNEEKSGITIHLVNEEYDKGKILFQAEVSIEKTDDAESLAQKIHLLEHRHFPKVVENYIRTLQEEIVI